MGYTHYWRRKREIPADKWRAILADVRAIIPELARRGVPLAGGDGKGAPKITSGRISFNGVRDCGHPEHHELGIAWPAKDAGGVANPWTENSKSGEWYAGAEIEARTCGGDCSHETFYIERVLQPTDYLKPDDGGRYFNCCKTAFKPYDVAVTAALIILRRHLGDEIEITSDGEDQHFFDGKMICQMALGYGLDFAYKRDLLTWHLAEVTPEPAEQNSGTGRAGA